MRSTEDPIAFTFSNPDAKRLLYVLRAAGTGAYEECRASVALDPQTFHRITRRLAQFDIVRIRAARGSEFKGRKVKVALELSPKGQRILPVLDKLDAVLRQNRDKVGDVTLQRLLPAPVAP